ncbi:MAG: hypothetical protein E5W53_16315 [Mesorhizobium sp.]|nr:MAG: hypothetical protein E5W53_16315 [Mesorhizobium sp.]
MIFSLRQFEFNSPKGKTACLSRKRHDLGQSPDWQEKPDPVLQSLFLAGHRAASPVRRRDRVDFGARLVRRIAQHIDLVF